jgi:galactose mutarotase-like enzyme
MQRRNRRCEIDDAKARVWKNSGWAVSEPGFQFYTENFLDASVYGEGDWVYGCEPALCLETQHFRDFPNQSGFLSTALASEQKYRSLAKSRLRSVFHGGWNPIDLLAPTLAQFSYGYP